MRLADFISANRAAILAAAVRYARALPRLAHEPEETLRDHIPRILDAIVTDLNQRQSWDQARAKSLGNTPVVEGAPETAAQTHGRLRAKSGLEITQLVAEYRALRASVLALWADAGAEKMSVAEVVRFDEAIDQAIAESVTYFSGEMEQLRNVFLGVLGHDLRGPLNAILLTSELISQLSRDPDVSVPVATLVRSGRRMAALLDTLLEYNRTTLGSGMIIHREQVDLAPECGAEVELLRASLPKSTIALNCQGNLRGEFDASRIREGMANLVSNAAAYGEEDSPIAVEIAEVGSMISLAVSNKGPKIPPAEAARMFEPLRRGSDPSHTRRTNLGLGLFIVEQIARAHRGSVRCVSHDGGTMFELMLPKQER